MAGGGRRVARTVRVLRAGVWFARGAVGIGQGSVRVDGGHPRWPRAVTVVSERMIVEWDRGRWSANLAWL